MDFGIMIADVDSLRHSYTSFALSQVRSPTSIGTTYLDRLDPLIGDKRLYKHREAVFHQGDPSRALYIVRSGSLKTFVADSAGGEQVLGFHLPGEVVGIGGLGKDSYLGTAEALESSNIWAIPHARLQPILEEFPILHQQLQQMVSRWADTNLEHLIIMGKSLAQVRLAMFLRGFASRCDRLSRDPLNLALPMSRRELASYLGLTLETVSREFSRMQAKDILAVRGKEVRILRADRLVDLCGDGQPLLHQGTSA